MNNKKRMENGNVNKNFSLELKYNHRFKSGEAEVTKKATLSTGGFKGTELSFKNILDFQKDVDKIFRQIKRLVTVDIDDMFSVTLTISAYEDVPEYYNNDGFKSGIHSILFDLWEYKGHGYDEGIQEGFYLNPDERYTEAQRAVYISFLKEEGSLFEQLAEQEWACEG